MAVLEFCFSSFWVYAGITFWLMLAVAFARAFKPIMIVTRKG